MTISLTIGLLFHRVAAQRECLCTIGGGKDGKPCLRALCAEGSEGCRCLGQHDGAEGCRMRASEVSVRRLSSPVVGVPTHASPSAVCVRHRLLLCPPSVHSVITARVPRGGVIGNNVSLRRMNPGFVHQETVHEPFVRGRLRTIRGPDCKMA